VTAVTDLTTRPGHKAKSEGERFVRLLELVNLVLVLVASAAVHLASGWGPLLWGTLVGGGIGVLNLRAMVFLGRRIIMQRPGPHGPDGVATGKAKYMILFTLKLVLLCTVVWLCLDLLPIDSIGFLIGFSTLLPAALVATALKSIERPTAPEERRP